LAPVAQAERQLLVVIIPE